MRRRRIIRLVVAACAITATLLVFLWPRHRVPEPRYEGKSFTEWLYIYCQTGRRPGFAGRPEAVHALQEMGTNALPFLLELMRHETPAWKVGLTKIAFNLPPAIQANRLLNRLQQDRAAQDADTTITAFSVLGSQALPAGPELVRLANDKKKAAYRAPRLDLRRHRGTKPRPKRNPFHKWFASNNEFERSDLSPLQIQRHRHPVHK